MNEVKEAKDKVCARVGTNVYGRVDIILHAIETGDDNAARRELLKLAKFFPRKERA